MFSLVLLHCVWNLIPTVFLVCASAASGGVSPKELNITMGAREGKTELEKRRLSLRLISRLKCACLKAYRKGSSRELMFRHVTGNHWPMAILKTVLLKASPSKSKGLLSRLAKIETTRIRSIGMAKKMKFVKTKTAIFFASDSSRLTPTWLLLFFTNRKSRMYKGRVAYLIFSMRVF